MSKIDREIANTDPADIAKAYGGNQPKHERLVIFASVNGRDNWIPVHENDVPAWVKDPHTMGRLVAGEQCMNCREGRDGSLWYCAVKVARTH